VPGECLRPDPDTSVADQQPVLTALATTKPQVSGLTWGLIDLRACRDSNPKPSDP
jgi:hypothetical protein